MFGSSDYNENLKLFFFRLKRKDENSKPVKPYFFVRQSKEGGFEDLPNAAFVAGNLVKVVLDQRVFEGKEYDIVKLHLQDGDERYILDLRYDTLTRQLFNNLIALESFENLKISVGETVSKKNGKTYASIYLTQNGKLVNWKYTPAEVPKPDEITNKKGEVIQRDYDEVNAFFKKELAELAERLSSAPKASPKKEEVEEDDYEEVETEDEIPF